MTVGDGSRLLAGALEFQTAGSREDSALRVIRCASRSIARVDDDSTVHDLQRARVERSRARTEYVDPSVVVRGAVTRAEEPPAVGLTVARIVSSEVWTPRHSAPQVVAPVEES